MKHTCKLLATIVLVFAGVSGCESNNDQVKTKVRILTETVTPQAILDAADLLPTDPDEAETLPLQTLPDAIAAFEPIVVQNYGLGSYLVVTAQWNQHQTGLFIAAPEAIVPESTKYVTYEKLGERVYLYQD